MSGGLTAGDAFTPSVRRLPHRARRVVDASLGIARAYHTVSRLPGGRR